MSRMFILISGILFKLYGIEKGIIRNLIRKLIYRLERTDVYSTTIRRIFRHYNSVELGLHSHGGCFIPGLIDKQTTIGRYCSITTTVRAMNRNHPLGK